MPKKEERHLRVCSKHRPSDYKAVPELRLTGHWFRNLGFEIGDQVSITTREKLLIIQPIEEVEEEIDYKTALQQVKQSLKKIS